MYSGWASDSSVATNLVPTRAEDGSDGSTSADASGGHDRHIHRRQNGVQKRQQRRRPAHVAARFHPLGDDQVAPGVGRRPSVFRRPHLPCRQCPTRVHEIDELAAADRS